MGNWLGGRTANLCTQLNNMAQIFDDIKKHFTQSNDTYYQAAQNLVHPATFAGDGAKAFLTAVDSDVNTLRPLLDGFGHLASSCDTLSSSISHSSGAYDGKIASIPYDSNVPNNYFDKWRDALINNLFTHADPGHPSDALGEVLQMGSSFTIGPWSTALNAVEATAAKDAEQYASDLIANNLQLQIDQWMDDNTPWAAKYIGWFGHDVLTKQQIKDQENHIHQQTHKEFMKAFDNLSADIIGYIKSWADELQNDYRTFRSAIQNPDDYLSARDIYDLIYYQSKDGNYKDGSQGTNSPITITPYTTKDGKKGLLITLGGTDLGHLTNDDSILAALETGEGLPTAYLVEIHNALETYMNEHPDMNGAELTLSGYSLGGMQAQKLATYLTNGDYPDLTDPKKHGLHVANVVTYGAPVMGPPANGVNYTMYDAVDDPIPLLSYYENPELLKLRSALTSLDTNPVDTIQQLWTHPGDAYNAYLSLIRADQLPWQQKVNRYIDKPSIDPNHQYHIIPITDVGTTSIGTGDPQITMTPVINPVGPVYDFSFNPGHQLNFQNHQQYQASSQLNSRLTSLNIDPSSLGPTEYFPLKA